ncbi:MAG: hypothetical protein KDB14_34150 [Planctomycetales bacterium]|nr:hypothetical protein [Planctomycetales bacterium]
MRVSSRCISVVFILGLGVSSQSATAADSVPKWIGVIEWHLSTIQTNCAFDLARDRQKSHPEDSLAHVYCGFLQMLMGYPNLAKENLEAAYKLRSDGVVENCALGMYLASEKDPGLHRFLERFLARAGNKSIDTLPWLERIWFCRLSAVGAQPLQTTDVISVLLTQYAADREDQASRMHGTQPISRVRFGALPCSAIVDTGSTVSSFHTAFAHLLPDVVDVAKIELHDSAVSAGKVAAPTIKAGGFTMLRSEFVYLMNFDEFRHPNYPFKGMLGVDCLKNQVFELDYAANRLAFMKDAPDPDKWDYVIPLSLEENVCSAKFLVNGREESFLIDTGCHLSGAINRPQQSEWRIPVDIQVGKDVVPSVLLEPTSGKQLIGAGFLARFRVCFDMPNKRMCLSRSENYKASDPSDLYGMKVQSAQKGLLITAVQGQGRAHRQGVSAGDIIIDVEGPEGVMLQDRLTMLGAKQVRIVNSKHERVLRFE